MKTLAQSNATGVSRLSPKKEKLNMNVIPFVRASQPDNTQHGASAIRELLDHAEVLATEQGLTELSFLIGLASVAANDISEGPATCLDL